MNADFCSPFSAEAAKSARTGTEQPAAFGELTSTVEAASFAKNARRDAVNLVTPKAKPARAAAAKQRPPRHANLVIVNHNRNHNTETNAAAVANRNHATAKTSANQLNEPTSLTAINRISGCDICNKLTETVAPNLKATTSQQAVASLITDRNSNKQLRVCDTCRQEILAKQEPQLCNQTNGRRNANELEQQQQAGRSEGQETNNQRVNVCDYSNSSSFWKFVSNLPRSITQRRTEEQASSLNSEVLDYLLAKNQLIVESGKMTELSGELESETFAANKSTSMKQETTVNQQRSSNDVNCATQADIPLQEAHRLIKVLSPLPNQNAIQSEPLIDFNSNKKKNNKLSIATTITTRSSVSSLSSCILSTSSTSEVRLKWGKKMDFLLSIIGFAVDLANIWRFPYLVYKNGGGVFFIPYTIMLVFGGIPLFFLELCLGQFVKKGPITVWNKICPSMKGVGYCSILVSWYVSFYYNVLIAWSVYFIYRSVLSFGSKMPWEDCDNEWNSRGTCVSISQLKEMCATKNETLESCRKEMFATVNVTSPASEFFVKELSQIDQSSGLDDMGYLRPELVFCLMVVYLLHYMSLFRGLETSGKVVWVTATAPYIILSILLVRGLFLPGASMGIEYYLSPKLERLSDPQVWIDAAGQVFYSIGVGFGVHLTYASFNSHNNNCHRDCLMTSAVNAVTSAYSGLVVFVYLGYMANNLGIEIEKVASEGYSLIFEVYPEALTTLPFARFWSILFFIMLLTLGIDSAMGGLESVITGLEDEFKFAKRLSRGQLTGLVILSSFLPALISCTQGGAYTIFWFDIYSAGVSLLFSALFETIGVVYCYGLKKFIPNIESMLGRKPHLFYIICWKYISPLFLGGVIFMSIYTASVPTYRNYTFPLWSIVLGWVLAFSSVAAVPIVAIFYWFRNRRDRLNGTKTYEKRKRTCTGSAASSSRHGSSSKKSPNHHTRPVSVSCADHAQSGVQTTTTTILTTATTTPNHGDIYERTSTSTMQNILSCRLGEHML